MKKKGQKVSPITAAVADYKVALERNLSNSHCSVKVPNRCTFARYFFTNCLTKVRVSVPLAKNLKVG